MTGAPAPPPDGEPPPGGAPETSGAAPAPEKVNLDARLGLILEQFLPHVVAELNGQQVKLAKLQGTFVWHHHVDEDELFLVLRGRLRMEFRDRTVELDPGEFIVVPRGVEHRPSADEEVHLLLFEPAGTLNTGNVTDARTRRDLPRI